MRKVDSSAESYKSKGMKAAKQSVGSQEKMKLDEGQHSCADGNDGSKAPAAKPASSHKLKKYS